MVREPTDKQQPEATAAFRRRKRAGATRGSRHQAALPETAEAAGKAAARGPAAALQGDPGRVRRGY